MKRFVIITVIVALFGWAIYDFVSKSNETVEPEGVESNEADDDIEIGLERGMRAPDFVLETTEGDSTRLSDFRGERVLLNFWATWCPPCRAEMPDMQKFHEDGDVVILGVNLTDTRNESEDVYPFLDEFGITFPILLDRSGEISYLYQIQPIPTSFLIDSHGIIQNAAYGPLNYELMVREFEKLD